MPVCTTSQMKKLCCICVLWLVLANMILIGILAIFHIHQNGYPQKYQHSLQKHCINCGYDIQINGQCCFRLYKQQYDCITYKICREKQNHAKQQDQKMYHFGLFLIISGIICILFLIYKLRKNQKQRRIFFQRRIQYINAQIGRIDMPLLPSLQKLNKSIQDQQNSSQIQPKIEIIKQQSFLGDGQNCSICLQGYSIFLSHQIRKPCKHKFHSQCLKQWYQRSKRCPLCGIQ